MGSENDLMELLWRDGQIVTHNHTQWNPENNLIHGEAPTSWFQYSSGDLFEYNSNISYETPMDIRSSGLQSMNESRRVGNSLSMVSVGSSNSERNQVQVVADMSHNSSDDGTSESGGSDFPFGRTEHFGISNQSQKRKMRNEKEKESEHHIEAADYDSIAANKMNQQSSSSERNRSNEVHNLSERRRRDRINEKMRALQELIPNCNKLDKASILDDAIEYLKSLQQQLQIMWSNSSMAPVMFPGGQHYIPSTGVGMSMGYVPFRGGSIASQMLPSQPIDPTLLNHRQLSDISKSYGHYPQYQVPTTIASGKRLPTSG